MDPALRRLDLNLLVVLDVLLVEHSVTAAARRLGMAQSSVSHALGRLREALGDPLLVRAGRGLTPTPRAQALHVPLRRALGELGALLQDGGGFAPASARRSFVLAAPDLLAPLLPAVLARLAIEAPGVYLEVVGMEPGVQRSLATGAVDLALGPVPAAGPDLVLRRLGVLPWAVVLRAGHPALAGPWTVEAWTAWPHVVVRTGSASQSLVGAALAAAGRSRRVGVTVGSFLAAPLLVAQTDLVLTSVAALVAPLAAPLGLVLRAPPLPIPALPAGALWHQRLHEDPAHRWLRTVVAEVVEQALGEADPVGAGA